MIDQLPEPLVAAEVDLRDFQYMELDVRTLRDSRFAAQVAGDAFRSGVLLWCAAWHQVPAGSLPDDDVELANLAGYGRFIKEWRKVRAEALTQFIKCSDGRLYHETVCEKAAAAWMGKLRHHYERARDRLRKVNKQRSAERLTPVPELAFEQWNQQRLSAGLSMEKADASAGIPRKDSDDTLGDSAEFQRKTLLEGKGEGKGEGEREETHTLPTSTEAGRVCLALKRTGLAGLNPGHPDLLALIAAGATEDEFVGAARTAIDKGKGFAYALGTLKRQRQDAAHTAKGLHVGPLPQTETTFQRTRRERVAEMTGGLVSAKPPGTQRPQASEVLDVRDPLALD